MTTTDSLLTIRSMFGLDVMTLTLTPITPITPSLSGVMTYDADAVTGISKKKTLTRDADSGTGDVQPCLGAGRHFLRLVLHNVQLQGGRHVSFVYAKDGHRSVQKENDEKFNASKHVQPALAKF
uniref:Velvet domain-containing protein n=1 Tax=Globodera pallida TaxID=36090 RepID=A0A183BXE2_GLOPA